MVDGPRHVDLRLQPRLATGPSWAPRSLWVWRSLGARRGGRSPAVVIPVASVAVALLTPVGPSLVTMPFTIGDYTHYISERGPPSILQMSPAVTVAMVGAVALAFARRGNRVSWALLSVIAVALGWTLLYTRTVTLGAAITTLGAGFSAAVPLQQSVSPDE